MKTSHPLADNLHIHHSGSMRWVRAAESHADHSIVHASIDSNHLLAGFPTLADDQKNSHHEPPTGIDSLAGIELMAQSIGARVAERFPERCQYLGFLLGVRRYRCQCDVLTYGEYEIEVRDVSLFLNEGIGIFDTRLLRDGTELASGQIKAFLAASAEQQQEILDGRLQ